MMCDNIGCCNEIPTFCALCLPLQICIYIYTLSYLLLQHAFSWARPSGKLQHVSGWHALQWLDAVHYASVMAQFGSLICMHQRYGSVLCTKAQCCASMAHCMMCIRQQYGSMLCIRHQYSCVSCINMA